MAVFMIVPTSDPAKLDTAIQQQFSSDALKLPRGEWLVKFTGTTQELSSQLNITNGESGSAVVVGILNYFGHAPTNIWEWLQSRWG
ncbi:hypothetical protein SAMN05444165_3952 [Paraburkholderia phenazinium]|uniref:Uncharacterized protein n=1 Tax=Paraburkholderia phenazinium TaxID=60549 RepID=A0A1N6KMJ0_9BURK|nr:hypothetical protein SAMN05444165_3952 [Paraburkholderia phenazinium]